MRLYLPLPDPAVKRPEPAERRVCLVPGREAQRGRDARTGGRGGVLGSAGSTDTGHPAVTVQRPQPTRPRLPRAARLQPDRSELDDRLAELARSYQPGVRWWWGHRKLDGINTIVCYLCGRTIVSRTGADRLSQRAADAVMLHRQSEADWHNPNPGNATAGTPSAVDAPPSEGSK